MPRHDLAAQTQGRRLPGVPVGARLQSAQIPAQVGDKPFRAQAHLLAERPFLVFQRPVLGLEGVQGAALGAFVGVRRLHVACELCLLRL